MDAIVFPIIGRIRWSSGAKGCRYFAAVGKMM